MTSLRVLVAFVAAVTVEVSTAPGAGKATGTFRLGTAQSAFTSACAFRVPDDSSAGRP